MTFPNFIGLKPYKCIFAHLQYNMITWQTAFFVQNVELILFLSLYTKFPGHLQPLFSSMGNKKKKEKVKSKYLCVLLLKGLNDPLLPRFDHHLEDFTSNSHRNLNLLTGCWASYVSSLTWNTQCYLICSWCCIKEAISKCFTTSLICCRLVRQE